MKRSTLRTVVTDDKHLDVVDDRECYHRISKVFSFKSKKFKIDYLSDNGEKFCSLKILDVSRWNELVNDESLFMEILSEHEHDIFKHVEQFKKNEKILLEYLKKLYD
jgi:hypothetical protein